MANVREPYVHPVPILSLRPTQMTVGMREVKEKRKRWREHKSEKKRAELLGKHMIPVVLGPDQRHYVVDHHHLARALHDEGVEDILVTVIGDLTNKLDASTSNSRERLVWPPAPVKPQMLRPQIIAARSPVEE